MPAVNDLPDILETTVAERLATGFVFTEGPLWHPDGYYYFVDIRVNRLYRITPGRAPELVRETAGGNGTTFDLEGRLIHCEGTGRRVVRTGHDGKVEVLVDRFKGGRFNRPNDVVCRSDGSIFFTDPDKRVPYTEREIPPPAGVNNLWDGACVYRVAPDGALNRVANCEYPNGLAFSPDERTLYVANTRSSKYIHAIEVDTAGKMVSRRIFADMNAGDEPGIPDGLKVESRAVAPGGFPDKYRRLAGCHLIELVAAQVDEVVVAIGMPERAFGKNESGCEALGFGGLQNIGQVVRGGHDLFLLSS